MKITKFLTIFFHTIMLFIDIVYIVYSTVDFLCFVEYNCTTYQVHDLESTACVEVCPSEASLDTTQVLPSSILYKCSTLYIVVSM